MNTTRTVKRVSVLFNSPPFTAKCPSILSVPLFQLSYWEVLTDDFSSILWNAVILLGSTQVALLSTPFLEKFFWVNSLLAQVDKLDHLSPISHVHKCSADSFPEQWAFSASPIRETEKAAEPLTKLWRCGAPWIDHNEWMDKSGQNAVQKTPFVSSYTVV